MCGVYYERAPATASRRDVQTVEDPLFIEKVRDIVEPYFSPPDRSLVRRRDSGQRRPVLPASF